MKKKPLKIDKRLPQIVLPKNKRDMFSQWWNSDIRYETTIPHAFEEGYLFIENGYKPDISKYSQLIKSAAKCFKTTYRDIENQLRGFLEASTAFILYFKFISDNGMIIRTYDANHEPMSAIQFEIGETGEACHPIDNDDELLDRLTSESTLEDIVNVFNHINIGLLITCLWYIATTSKTTKYVYERKTPIVKKRHKDVVIVSDVKTINTPIYDMSRIRVVKIESLNARKKGWTYSHSFQVHGHYRHYKNGKTTFINSYIKGKDKDFKTQQIVLSPEQ